MSLAWKSVTDDQVLEHLRKQHAVKLWLEEVQGIHFESDELFEPLRSGVVLCYTMAKLDDRSIPVIHTEPEGKELLRFKMRENVDFFLSAIEEIGVPKYRRFATLELVDGNNMPNVVECLFEFAKIVHEEYEGAPDILVDEEWVPEEELPATKKNQLKKLLVKVKKKPKGDGKKVVQSSFIVRKKLQLLAGNGVDIESYTPGFIGMQALVRGYIARQEYRKMVRDQAYRDNVAKEILSTERVYVNALKTLVDVWITPLSTASKPCISKEDQRTIFSEITTICTLNTGILNDLEDRVGEWNSGTCLGDIFLQIADYLKSYSPYVQNFNKALMCIDRVSKKKGVVQFFEECRLNERCNRLDLPSFLIMPVQRIPRYVMLLEDMLKHTWPSHPDYDNLEKATRRIGEIGDTVNERKRQAEQIQQLLVISARLSGKIAGKMDLAEPHRRFLLEAHFQKGTKQEVVVYLFTDLLLLGKPEKKGGLLGGKQQLVRITEKHILRVTEASPGTLGKGISSIELSKTGNKKITARIPCDSEGERDAWIEAITQAKEELKGTRDSVGARASVGTRASAFGGRSSSNPISKKTAAQQLADREKRVASMPAGGAVINPELKALLKRKEDLEAEIESTNQSLAKAKKKQKAAMEDRLEEIQVELDDVEAAIAGLEPEEELATRKLRRKEKVGEPNKGEKEEDAPPSKPKEGTEGQKVEADGDDGEKKEGEDGECAESGQEDDGAKESDQVEDKKALTKKELKALEKKKKMEEKRRKTEEKKRKAEEKKKAKKDKKASSRGGDDIVITRVDDGGGE